MTTYEKLITTSSSSANWQTVCTLGAIGMTGPAERLHALMTAQAAVAKVQLEAEHSGDGFLDIAIIGMSEKMHSEIAGATGLLREIADRYAAEQIQRAVDNGLLKQIA